MLLLAVDRHQPEMAFGLWLPFRYTKSPSGSLPQVFAHRQECDNRVRNTRGNTPAGLDTSLSRRLFPHMGI